LARKKAIPVGTTETMEMFLARGGKVTVCPSCARTPPEEINYKWKPQRGRKKKEDKSVDLFVEK
jgi:hypothetical protein